MTDLIHRLKSLPIYLSAPLGVCAVYLIMIYSVCLIPLPRANSLYEGFNSGITFIFAVLSAAAINFNICKNRKKAALCAGAVLFYDLVLFSLCEMHISLVFAIILSLLFSFICKKQSLFYSFIICLLISLILALSAGMGYEYFYRLLRGFCAFLKGKGALYGASENAYSLLFGNSLKKVFLGSDYSGSAYSKGKIISGVLDLFKTQKVAGINCSKYLSGKYFANIFLPIGISALVFQKLERRQKTPFILCLICAAVFGDVRLFSLFLLIYNPLMYLGYLVLISLSYFSAYILDIRIMHFGEGSVFELAKYMDKIGYFLAAGAVLAILSFFFESIILSKFDFQSRKILPLEVRKTVSALGGERNIERIEGETVYLRNPNLTDILKIDCEIHGNAVTLLPDEFASLKKFFCDEL